MKDTSKFVRLEGWNAVTAAGGVLFAYAGTALLVSWPLAWLINRTFAPSAIRAVFGGNTVTYWQCVMVFAIWYCARVRVNFPFTVRGKF